MHPYIRGNGGRNYLPSADSTSLHWVSTLDTAVVRGERNPMGTLFPGGDEGLQVIKIQSKMYRVVFKKKTLGIQKQKGKAKDVWKGLTERVGAEQ